MYRGCTALHLGAHFCEEFKQFSCICLHCHRVHPCLLDPFQAWYVMTQVQQYPSVTCTLDENISGDFGKRWFLAEDLCCCSDLHRRQSPGSSARSVPADLLRGRSVPLSLPAAGPHQGKQLHLQQSPRFPPCSRRNLLGTDAKSKLSPVTSSAALLSGCWVGKESSPAPLHGEGAPCPLQKAIFCTSGLLRSFGGGRGSHCNLGPRKKGEKAKKTGKEEE